MAEERIKTFRGVDYKCEDANSETFNSFDKSIRIIQADLFEGFNVYSSHYSQKDLCNVCFNFIRGGKVLVRLGSIDS